MYHIDCNCPNKKLKFKHINYPGVSPFEKNKLAKRIKIYNQNKVDTKIDKMKKYESYRKYINNYMIDYNFD